MRGQEKAEVWAYRCAAHGVTVAVDYPIGYKGNHGLKCPQCDQYMVVKNSPPQGTEDNVFDMYQRRQAQIMAEQVRALKSKYNPDEPN